MIINKTAKYDFYFSKLPRCVEHDIQSFETALESNLYRIEEAIKSNMHHNACTNKSKCLTQFCKPYSIWKLYIARKTDPNPKKGFRVYTAYIIAEQTWYLHIIYLKNEYDKQKSKIEKDEQGLTKIYHNLNLCEKIKFSPFQ